MKFLLHSVLCRDGREREGHGMEATLDAKPQPRKPKKIFFACRLITFFFCILPSYHFILGEDKGREREKEKKGLQWVRYLGRNQAQDQMME